MRRSAESRLQPARRSRIHRLFKWAGTAASVVILLAGAACLRWKYVVVSDGKQWDVRVESGSIGLLWHDAFRFSWISHAYDPGFTFGPRSGNWEDVRDSWGRSGLLPRLEREDDALAAYVHVWVPIWMLLALNAPLTGWLWFRDRRTSAVRCVCCAHDLRGKTSGHCPECGAGCSHSFEPDA